MIEKEAEYQSLKLPEFIYPATLGETHLYYGDSHNNHFDYVLKINKTSLESEQELNEQNIFKLVQEGTLLIKYNENEILDKFSDFNITNINSGLTLLHIAAKRGHINIVKFLIEKTNIKVDNTDSEGESAILKASAEGYIKIVQYLFYNGSKIQQCDKDGWTVLHNACSNGNLELVKWLVQKTNVDVNVLSRTCFTPLMTCVSRGWHDIAEYLISVGQADILIKNEGGEMCYDIASCNFEEEMAALILNNEKLIVDYNLTNTTNSSKQLNSNPQMQFFNHVLYTHKSILLVAYEYEKKIKSGISYFMYNKKGDWTNVSYKLISNHEAPKKFKFALWNNARGYNKLTDITLKDLLKYNNNKDWIFWTEWMLDMKFRYLDNSLDCKEQQFDGWLYSLNIYAQSSEWKYKIDHLDKNYSIYRKRRWIRVITINPI